MGPRRISPIFRDVTELTAHHSLSSKIEDAVRSSRYMIVLCSPASKASHWVNEEIKLFRQLHGEDSILCALIEGTPKTSFPPALTEMGREPLAANLNSKNFRLGTMQLAASILEVGLDDLAQRETRRRRKRMYAVVAGSLLFSGVMAISSWNAVNAQNKAETSRNEAEKLVEFMLMDLKDDLDAIGKLGIIDSVGDQVRAYYEAISIPDMDNDRLARRARALHVLGHVAITQGNREVALKELNEARTITAEILRRAPDDQTALLAHANSEYSLLRFYENKNPRKAMQYGLSSKTLSERLYNKDKSNLKYALEYAWAHNKLGQLYQTLKDNQNAKEQFLEATSIYVTALTMYPNNNEVKLMLITSRRNSAIIKNAQGHHDIAIKSLSNQVEKLEELLENDADNFEYTESLYLTKIWIQHIQIMKLNKCDPNQIYGLTTGLEKMVIHDPSNEGWKSDFINFAYKAIKNCSSSLDDGWSQHTATKSRAIYQQLSQKNDLLSKKVIWLEQNQAQ